MTMRFFGGFTLGATLVIIAWTRGAWILGRILAVPADADYGRRT